MKNKQCRTHRRSQGEPRGPCAPNFSISSHFVLWEVASQTKVLLFAWSQTFGPPLKLWVGYTTGRTSNDHDDKKKLVIINTIQLSLLYFFCVTRLGTAKRCQYSVIFLFLGWRKLGCFFCLVPPLVRNFDSVPKTSLQQWSMSMVNCFIWLSQQAEAS